MYTVAVSHNLMKKKRNIILLLVNCENEKCFFQVKFVRSGVTLANVAKPFNTFKKMEFDRQ